MLMEKVKVEIFLLYKIHRINLKTFKVFSLPYWSKSFKALFIQGIEFLNNICKKNLLLILFTKVTFFEEKKLIIKIIKSKLLIIIYHNRYYWLCRYKTYSKIKDVFKDWALRLVEDKKNLWSYFRNHVKYIS